MTNRKPNNNNNNNKPNEKKRGQENMNKSKNNPFVELCEQWEKVCTMDNHNDTAYITAGNNLARACVFSVLKKLYDTAPDNNKIKAMRQEVAAVGALLDIISRANEQGIVAYNSDGVAVPTDTDTALVDAAFDALAKLAGLNDGGKDLINDAWAALLTITAQTETKKRGWMLKSYTITHQKRIVYKSGAEMVEMTEKEQTPIQYVWSYVRKQIQQNASPKGKPTKYTYVESMLADEHGNEYDVYIRYNQADVGDYVTDYNGKETFYTPSADAHILDARLIAAKAQLTAGQYDVLAMRIQGKSNDEIAKRLGISRQAVIDRQKRIAAKVQAAGIGTHINISKNSPATKAAAAVAMYDPASPDKPLAVFDSIGQAAAVMDIHKGKISEVCKGIRKTAGGYTFRKIEQ